MHPSQCDVRETYDNFKYIGEKKQCGWVFRNVLIRDQVINTSRPLPALPLPTLLAVGFGVHYTDSHPTYQVCGMNKAIH
jgi:hypothetical protein